MVAQLLLLGSLLTKMQVTIGQFEQQTQEQQTGVGSALMQQSSLNVMSVLENQQIEQGLSAYNAEYGSSSLMSEILGYVMTGASLFVAVATCNPALVAITVSTTLLTTPMFNGENAMQEIESHALQPLFEDMGMSPDVANLVACSTMIVGMALAARGMANAGAAAADEAADEGAAAAESAGQTGATTGISQGTAMLFITGAQAIMAGGLGDAIAQIVIDQGNYSKAQQAEIQAITNAVLDIVSAVAAGVAAWKMVGACAQDTRSMFGPESRMGAMLDQASPGLSSTVSACAARMLPIVMRGATVIELAGVLAQAGCAFTTGAIDLKLSQDITALGHEKGNLQFFNGMMSILHQSNDATIKNVGVLATALSHDSGRLGQAYAGAGQTVTQELMNS
jgi:hypothetical protein